MKKFAVLGRILKRTQKKQNVARSTRKKDMLAKNVRNLDNYADH